jgi:hypothetical protein
MSRAMNIFQHHQFKLKGWRKIGMKDRSYYLARILRRRMKKPMIRG